MIKKIFFIILSTLIGVAGCHKPDELIPPVSRNGINSITVSFTDGTGDFTTVVEEGGTEIIIDIPYYFPENSTNIVTEEMISKMKAKANLDDNVVLEPLLLFLDLTKQTPITVIDQKKQRKQYTIKGNIKKSDACSITDFQLPGYNLSGVINETEGMIFLVSAEDFPTLEQAELTLSYHATISPDPRVEALDYNQDQQLTVTAHDGVTKKVYTVKKAIPEKIPYGIRSGSGRLLFAKQLSADLGVAPGVTRGISLSENYLVLNSSGQNSTYLHALTGEKLGEVNLGAIKGINTNYYATSDNDGNILVSNMLPQGGSSFNIWKLNSIHANPELLINYPTTNSMGKRFSINGSIDGDAVLTAPLTGGTTKFARWKITGGSVDSQTPEIVTIDGLTGTWNNSSDVISSSSTDVSADYYVHAYSNYFSWIDGASNKRKPNSRMHFNNNNFLANAIDLKTFNNATYLAIDWTNGQAFGGGDRVFLLDASNPSKLTGNLEITGAVEPLVWRSDNTFGARSISTSLKGSSSDVLMRVSDNGYYLYLYFLFTDGYVVGYQFDCIKM